LPLAITNGNVIDVETGDAIPDAVVLIDDRRIQRVGRSSDVGLPDGTAVIDVGGGWILPGLINLHGHFSLDGGPSPAKSLEGETELFTAMRATGHARQALETGVTTIRELGSRAGLAVELRDAIAKGHVMGPRIYASGLVLVMSGGHGDYIGRVVDGPEEMRKAIREQIGRGVDVIKLMATGGVAGTPGNSQIRRGFTVDEMRAAAEEAHRAEIKVTAHANNDEGVRDCVEAGLDCIEHGIGLSDATVEAMRDRDVPLVSTLSVHQKLLRTPPGDEALEEYKRRADRFSEARKESFRRAVAAGVRIGAGSDAGTVMTSHDNFVMELELMVACGLSPMDAIRAATSGAADILGIGDIGALSPSQHADLIVAEEDPRDSIQALRNLTLVVKAGDVVVDRLGSRSLPESALAGRTR
jgi:imidazolonepropionase-like amidohydrolase